MRLSSIVIFLSFFLIEIRTDEIIPAEAIVETAAPPPTPEVVESVTRESKVIDSSIHSPINKNDKDLEQLKKSIQAKMKKLRRLKQEAKQLEAQLRKQRKIKALENVPISDQPATIEKWKARMRRRVKAILKKVNKMEKQMKKLKTRKNRHSKPAFFVTTLAPAKMPLKKKQNPHKIRKNKVIQLTTTMPTTVVHDPSFRTEKPKIVKRSKFSENGEICGAHKDCAPGHCCHHFEAQGKSVCIKHDLNPGSSCKHSCACAGGMKCVKLFTKGLETEAQCRLLNPDELAHLVSENPQKHHPRFPLHF